MKQIILILITLYNSIYPQESSKNLTSTRLIFKCIFPTKLWGFYGCKFYSTHYTGNGLTFSYFANTI